ncbi:uncharacterized protein TM35_000771030 [Trypanosoma theileri]|uniref:Uncharacterized protein n=1 Tax=Trypanosoma theileri TaxID=67003 RepID=A0A1X0NFQ5_9TRYP|nr:uncharacterized protein TM35_000771030 [Trypanosoma theileri]ORC83141.1 hypothetical protein TM35_000771030 [Trypanosoma theileri]
MSMLPCRVLCLLAIVLCCVGVVTEAADYSQSPAGMYVKALRIPQEALKLKEECEKAGKDAEKAADSAYNFVATLLANIEAVAADPARVKKERRKGHELITKAEQASAKARKEGDKTTDSATGTKSMDTSSLEQAKKYYENGKNKLTETVNSFNKAIKAVKDAEHAARYAKKHADRAEEAAERVKDVLKKLDAAVAEAEKKKKEEKVKKEKQVESQPQEQKKDTSLGGQQGHTEGNKSEQTQTHTQVPAVKEAPLERNEGSVAVGADDTRDLLNTGVGNGDHLVGKHHIDTEESNTSEDHHDEEGYLRQTVGEVKSGHITTNKENQLIPPQRKQTQEEGVQNTHTSVKMEELKELHTVPHHAQEKKEEEHNSTYQRPHGRSGAREMTEDLHTPQTPTQEGNLSENQTHSGKVSRQTHSLSYPPSSDAPNIREMAANALLKSDALAKAVQQLDGSSSPALLRVPLLLLLSVLGCMAVC